MNNLNEKMNVINKKKVNTETFKKKKADLGLKGLEIKIKDLKSIKR